MCIQKNAPNPPEPSQTPTTQTLTRESNPPVPGGSGGSDLDIARILHSLNRRSIVADAQWMPLMVDEIVHALDQLDVEEPHHVGLLTLVAALFHRHGKALLLPDRLARRFA